MKLVGIILGTVSLVLGVIGIFLPVLPTTPFLLLTAFLYFHSSDRLYHWLITHPRLGFYIRMFREEKAIPLHAKIISLLLMWASILYCTCVVLTSWWLRLFLWIISAGVTIYILSLKTKR